MPNILLTTRCNLTCAYCFAQEKLASTRQNMPLENVRQVIEFLQRSQFPIFRVMGGEPTLHPQFGQILQMALAAGMRVDVLSNATWSEETGALFASIAPRQLMFLLNVDHPDQYSPRQWAVIERNLAGLAGRGGITLSFNIFEKQPRSAYVLDLAERYDIKYIRLSLSLPVLGAGNACLPFSGLPEVAPFVLDFAGEAEQRGISVKFDNAVPLCMFSEAQLGWLLLHGVYDLERNTRCDPIIDIGPDLTIWSCFCLSGLKNRRLDEFETLAEAQAYYRQVWGVYQDKVFPLLECENCFYRQRWGCQGGCLTYAVQSDGGRRYGVPAEPAAPVGQAVRLAQDVRLYRYELPRPVYLLRKAASNLDFELDDALQPALPLLDGRHSLDEIAAQLSQAQAPGGRLQDFARGVLAERIPDVLDALLRQGFLEQAPRERG